MKIESGTSNPETCLINGGIIRGFVEEYGIHVLLEVSIVGILDGFLKNTILSMLAGIFIVEGCQLLWRKLRGS